MSYPEVTARVLAAAERAGRDPAGITVVAVSKTMTAEQVFEIYEHGHRDFGENRAQELAEKAPHLPGDIRWHFVGTLQSNKARMVRDVVGLLHSMDRRSLATAWMKGRGPPPPVLVQVNIGEESQKSGLAPGEVASTVAWMIGLGLDMRGLMAIPPIPKLAEESRAHFAALRRMRDDLVVTYPTLTELSMGMTDDFEVAIEEGASIIRVGRAIFGPRN